MRLLIISDAHGNPWALEAVERAAGPVDAVLFAGDAVNYGPRPAQVLAWLQSRAASCVRGNHDQALVWGDDPQAAPSKAWLAAELLGRSQARLDPSQLRFLRSFPLALTWQMPGLELEMVHASKADPLYDYRLQPDAEATLFAERTATEADLLVLGHTHLPLRRRSGDAWVVNPGSVGQPLDGDPRACYATWEDGELSLRRAEYDRQPLLRALGEWGLPGSVQDELVRLYRTARLT
jgi:putative phosphoesterase